MPQNERYSVSLQELCNLFERLRDGAFFWDSELRLIACNDIGCRLYGLDPAFMTPGRAFMEMIAALPPGRFARQMPAVEWESVNGPDTRERLLDDFERGVTFEVRFAGDRPRVLIGARAVFREGVLATVVTDVTAREENARAIEREKSYFDTILENMSEGVALVGEDGRVVAYNRGILELYRIDPAAVRPGDHASAFIDAAADGAGLPPAEREAIAAERLQRATSPQPGRVRYDRQLPDGRSLQGTRIGLPDGRAVVVVRDMTAEAELERRRAELATIVENLHEGVAMVGRDGRMIAFNGPFLDKYGIRRDAVRPGDHVSRFVSLVRDLDWLPLDEQERRRADRLEFALEKEGRAEVRRELGTGCVLAVSRTPLEGSCLFTFRDVTAEEERLRLLEQARHDREEAARIQSEFLARMSHELRTPMQGVLGMAALLDRTGLDARQQQCLDVIRASGKHMLELIEDLLTLSALDSQGLSLNPAPCLLAQPLKEAVDILRPQSREKGLSMLVASLPPEDLVVEVDAKRLRQIMINLVGNAVRHTQAGGLTVSCSIEPTLAPGRVAVEIAVSDTGPGITEEFQEEIFDRFRQLQPRKGAVKEGVGLGLPISRSLARMMGGDVTVESTGEGGSTFFLRLELPLAAEPSRDAC